MKLPLRRQSPIASAGRGQALVELAVILPILLLLLVLAIDFGRLFFSWVGLHNAARIGADYAAQFPDADYSDPNDPRFQAYADRILSDAAAINCEIVPPPAEGTAAPDGTLLARPSFPNGSEVGDDAVVHLECDFDLITPVASGVVGSPVRMTAEAIFPIRKGFVGVPAGAGDGEEEPDCALVPDMVGGTVAEARGAWRDRGFTGFFAPASGFDDDTVTSQTTTPISEPEEDCIPLSATAVVESETAEGCPSGQFRIPLLTSQTVAEARDDWDASIFTGSFSPSGQNNAWAQDQAPAAGACAAPEATMTITIGPTPTPKQCNAPDFVGRTTGEAPGLWSAAEFTGTITYRGSPPYIIRRQSLVAGQPYDCTAGVSLWPEQGR